MRWMSRRDWAFFGLLICYLGLGLAGGYYLPWYSILGLSVVFGSIWFIGGLTFDQYRSGIFETAFVIGIPIMLIVSWITFWLSLGLRA